MVRLIDLTKVVDLDGINQIKQTHLIKSVLCFTLNFQKKTFREGESVGFLPKYRPTQMEQLGAL